MAKKTAPATRPGQKQPEWTKHICDDCKHARWVETHQNKDWEIVVMERKGVAFCRIAWDDDDPDTVYIDSLSVDKDMRQRGIARHILTMLETVGCLLGAKQCRLSVIVNSWIYDWYKRRGYVDYSDHDDNRFIWMQKEIRRTGNE